VTFGKSRRASPARASALPQARHAVSAPARRRGGAGPRRVRSASRWPATTCSIGGNDAFFETKANLEAAGVQVVGAGATIAEARRPAVFALGDGTRVAILAYSSILPHAYWADARRPGCAPMRAFTVYEQIEHDQPGTPARIHTYPHREDLAAMEADIRAAKEAADVVVVSHHWGIHFVRATIADYQRDVARSRGGRRRRRDHRRPCAHSQGRRTDRRQAGVLFVV
jgi:poly-gamma-glutamate synthesis protein (capsule biosynthesis protein)